MAKDSALVAVYARRVLSLGDAALGDEYYYGSLPLAVLDAVFSIGVRYASVRNVVDRYCSRFAVTKLRRDRHQLPLRAEQEPVSAFCTRFEYLGIEAMVGILCSKHRTSPRNGILKADAAYRFASALRAHRIEYLQDAAAAPRTDVERMILDIPGQRSGISLRYFWMLAGADDFIKPDRMVFRFLEAAVGRVVLADEAQALLAEATEILSADYPALTPRLLDHEIWKYQREQSGPPKERISSP
ncbi:MAG TPA: hypothetical protein VED01_20220 [Burkholderiales bacterium]|nr:hypothetical protein [Burkholderiales bacterium]